MTAEIKTRIGQLNIAGGAWRNDAPNQVAVREPKSADVPGAGKGDLFVLTEVRGLGSERVALEQQLAQTIRDTYYLSRGSVTASLRRALQATNNELYRHNRTVKAKKKIVAGAVVLVMRDDEAFVAQIGPTVFFAVLGSLVRRYPAQSLWLDDSPNPKEPALGLNAMVEPNLHHLQVTPGDILILADSRLGNQLPLDKIVKAVVPGKVKATIKNLGKTGAQRDCSAMTVAIIPGEQSPLAALRRHAPAQVNRLFERGSQPVSPPKSAPPPELIADLAPKLPATSGPMPAKMQPAPQNAGMSKMSGWLGRFSKKSTAAAEAGLEGEDWPTLAEDNAEFYSPKPDDWPEESYETQPSGPGRVMDSVAQDPGFHPEFKTQSDDSFSLGRIFRWISAGLLLLVALLGNGLKNILRTVLPDTQHQTPPQAGVYAYKQGEGSGSWTLLRNIVIVIPVIVAIVVAISYLQKGRLQEAEYNQFIAAAQEKFQQAQAVNTDSGAALGLMAEAEGALAEAENIKGTQPVITDLREQLRQTADRIGKVQRLYYLPQLRQYTESGTNLKRLVLQGLDLYVLDVGTHRIFHHRLDDLGETLLPDDDTLLLAAKGQQVDALTVGNLINMTWMPAGGNRQTSDLVILSDAGLLEYNPNWGITTSTLANREAFGSPTAVSHYFGNFYVLDPPTNQILRYLPTADGYSDLPEGYFPEDQEVNLANAVDVAIDGAIYVLFADGRVGKFEGGAPVGFNITGLDIPLRNPVAIFTAPDEDVQYVYIADAGNQRVVQLEKDGRFVRQFRPSAGEAVTFANLQDIFVDEISGRLYILDSNNLYASNIPTVAAE